MKNKLIYTTTTISLILYTATYINPVQAQLGRPQVGVKAPPSINFFRVALIPKQIFKSEEIAKLAIGQLDKDFNKDLFKLKVIKVPNGYQVAMMIRMMFFDKDQAEAALNFLKENPNFAADKYDLQIISDSSY